MLMQQKTTETKWNLNSHHHFPYPFFKMNRSETVSLLMTHSVNHRKSGVWSFPRLTFCSQMEPCAEAKWQSILSSHMGLGMWGWQVCYKLRSCHNPAERLRSAESATGVWTKLTNAELWSERTKQTHSSLKCMYACISNSSPVGSWA